MPSAPNSKPPTTPLLERKLLQPSPYYPVSGDQGAPRLTVTIHCKIKPCPIDLPK